MNSGFLKGAGVSKTVNKLGTSAVSATLAHTDSDPSIIGQASGTSTAQTDSVRDLTGVRG